MNILYLDCSSGISGNMLLGALINAGMPFSHLQKELKKLRISHLVPRTSKVKRHSISATYFNTPEKDERSERQLSEILSLIKKSRLSPPVKKLSSDIFNRLGEAESKVHGVPLKKVHFHEVGALDSIVDIVGFAIAYDHFKIKEVFCSPLNVGSGRVKCRHGWLPVPAPATSLLLKGIPIYDSGIKKELVTPTGAAIVKTIVKRFGPLPRIKVEKTGFGAGSYDLKEQPNILRIFIGEKEIQTEKDAVLMIEANIDDLDPKLYDRAIAGLMKSGALDAYIQPIRMKKGRNAIQLVALCAPDKKDQVAKTIFDRTTTLGIRAYLVEREKLDRVIKKTKYGRIKLGSLEGKIKTLSLEPDDYMLKKFKPPLSKIFRGFNLEG